MTFTPLDSADLPDPIDVSNNVPALAAVRATIDAGPFDDTWESLSGYTIPLWYTDAKFGIFLHWGVYSVPAYGSEWYSRSMYLEGTEEFEHHRATYGGQDVFGYKDFIPSFTMKQFDPQAWVEVFRDAGAQFVVPVAEHHDGFAMYDSDRSRWTAVKMGPQRDVFGELLHAVDEGWLVKGASSHRAEHWFFMNDGTRFDSDVLDPRFVDFYGPAQREETAPNERFLEDWLLRTCEVIDKYRPQVLWFDWWIEQPAFEPYLRQLAAYYYNRAAEWGREVVINFKWGAFRPGTAVYDIERGTVGGVQTEIWQNDTSVSRGSWAWVEGHEYKTVTELLHELLDVVSKNGVLLLNIGPKPDGTLAAPEVQLLRGIGNWLSRNGEAVFGSRPWTIPAEGPTYAVVGSFVDGDSAAYTDEDVRFTTRHDMTGDYVYATVMAPVSDGTARIRSFGVDAGLLGREIADVRILGSDADVSWNRRRDALYVNVPDGGLHGIGPVVRVWLQDEPKRPRTDFLHG